MCEENKDLGIFLPFSSLIFADTCLIFSYILTQRLCELVVWFGLSGSVPVVGQRAVCTFAVLLTGCDKRDSGIVYPRTPTSLLKTPKPNPYILETPVAL